MERGNHVIRSLHYMLMLIGPRLSGMFPWMFLKYSSQSDRLSADIVLVLAHCLE